MMEMGGHVATGLGHGIEAAPTSPAAMGQMADTVAGAGALALTGPSLPAASAPAFARGDHGARPPQPAAPITIHIHQQPGEDAQALAERVGRILERKGKGHGAFADDF
jgi:hypothetical protein